MRFLPLYFFIALFTLGFAMEVDAAQNEPSIVMETAPSSTAAKNYSSELNRHAFSTELLGRAGLYSLNYDYQLQDDLALGAGFSSYSITAGSSSANAMIIPLYANYYFFAQGEHRIFATAGADLVFASGKIEGSTQVKGSGLAGVIGAGYEYRGDTGFLFRAAPYLLVGKASGAWIGFSFGYTM